MPTRDNNILVSTLVDLLNGGNAHAGLKDALRELPFEAAGIVPPGLPYSIWQLAEHIRIAQWDILEFSRSPEHKSPEWPAGYWPTEKQPVDPTAWENCLRQIDADRNAFISLLEAPDADLYTPFPHGTGQTLLKEALVLADHNSYHTGEIIIIRRLLGNWKS